MTWERQQPAWYNPPTEQRSQNDCFYHEWKPILLLNSTVFNCSRCDKKKEVYEREEKEKNEKDNGTSKIKIGDDQYYF